MGDLLPVAAFDSADLPPRARYDAWRNLICAVFEPSSPAGSNPQDLRATVRSVHFGQVMVTHAIAESQYFTRSRRLVATESLDHFMIQIYRRGVCEGAYGERHNVVRTGDIKVIDMARTFHSLNTDFDNITLTVPRNLLAPLLARPDDLHGMVLPRRSPIACMLASHIRGLIAHAASLGAAEGAMLAAGTIRLVAACLGPNPRAQDDIRPVRIVGLALTVRDYIDQHLDSPQLEPDMLARRFKMSRAQLYRLFEAEQGVAAYIRSRRLECCLMTLTDPAQAARAIGDIALGFGFSSESHFSRLFRRAFGITPSDARADALGTARSVKRHQHTFINDWMRGLQRTGDLPDPLASETGGQAI